jgi:hypothetical protein
VVKVIRGSLWSLGVRKLPKMLSLNMFNVKTGFLVGKNQIFWGFFVSSKIRQLLFSLKVPKNSHLSLKIPKNSNFSYKIFKNSHFPYKKLPQRLQIPSKSCFLNKINFKTYKITLYSKTAINTLTNLNKINKTQNQ